MRKIFGLFLFSSLCFLNPYLVYAQSSEADLEVELTTEPEIAPAPAASSSGRGDLITVERMKDPTLPYKQRRNPWGVLFSINYEQFSPTNYQSLVLNQNYETMTDNKSIPLIGAEFGVKYNFSLGSISALVGYSTGKIDTPTASVDQISASITKVDLNMALDNLFDEPYVVPYAQVGLHSIDWTEKSLVGAVINEESFITKWNVHYKAGLSFQLNWIEKSIDASSQEDSVRSGLENTYLDVFYSSYAQPSQVANVNGAEGEADLQSSEIGAGLKLEF
jgi:hypothetical protein